MSVTARRSRLELTFRLISTLPSSRRTALTISSIPPSLRSLASSSLSPCCAIAGCSRIERLWLSRAEICEGPVPCSKSRLVTPFSWSSPSIGMWCRRAGNLEVARTSLDAAEATYKHDKRALELGALPPLDIYRSESQVAGRRVQVIQSEYALKQTEDAFRQTVGADLDPYFRALDLDLTQSAEPAVELPDVDAATALQQAMGKRQELEVARQSLANDDTSIRLAHNNLLPDLRLGGNYSGNGLGGNPIWPWGSARNLKSHGSRWPTMIPVSASLTIICCPICVWAETTPAMDSEAIRSGHGEAPGT